MQLGRQSSLIEGFFNAISEGSALFTSCSCAQSALRTTALAITVLSCLTLTYGPSAEAQDAAAAWGAISQAPFDAAKYSTAEDVTLVKDRVQIHITSGTIQVTQPVNGIVYGAAFDGRGHIHVDPPNAMEAQQLHRFTEKDTLDTDFSQATFTFSDDTFDQFASQLHWKTAPDDDLANLYQKRQQDREDAGQPVTPRLFEGIFSGDRKRTGYFLADLKTSDKGWIQVQIDALDPEAIQIGRLDQWTARMGFDTWMHFPAGNMMEQEAFHDPVGFQNFDVPVYEIDSTVTSGAEFSATALVHVNEHYAGERVLLFDLDSNLRVSAVKDASGAALLFFQARERGGTRTNSYGDFVDVFLPQATEKGHQEILEFTYAGKNVVRKVGPGNYFCQSDLWYPEPDYSAGTNFVARSTFSMTFHAPKQFQLVATGTKTGETSDGKTITTTWKSDSPLTVAGFAFGDYKLVTADANGVKVEVYANTEPDDQMEMIQKIEDNSRSSAGNLSPQGMAQQMSQEVANAMRVFQGFYGPAPYQRLAVTNIEYSYGQGWPMLLYLSSLSFLDPTQRHMIGIPMQDELEFSDFFRAHEVSHQWWGHRVAWTSYHDQWLSEGFAQFSGNLYVQFRESWKEYLTRLEADKMALSGEDLKGRKFETDGPIWMGDRLASSDSERAYDVDIYDKGGYVLHMLRMMLSDPTAKDQDARFKDMMQDFTKTYEGKAASTEDFKAIAEKHMIPVMDVEGNHRLDWFFRQYVYGTGYAHYNFSWSIQQVNGKWQVSGTVTRSGVPDTWVDIVPVYLHVSGKVAHIGWITARKNTESFSVALPVKPDKITINDNDDILADVKQ